MKTHFGFRASENLHEAISLAGDPSAAARALIIIGLAECGYDVSALAGDVVLLKIDPGVQQKLLSVLHKRVTDVQQPFNTPHLIPRHKEEEEEEADPLMSIGIAV